MILPLKSISSLKVKTVAYLLVHQGVSYNVYKELHSTVLGVLVRIMHENVHM